MLSTKKTFLALLTASVLYESSAAVAVPTKSDDRVHVLLPRRSTGQKANQNTFQPTRTLLTKKGSLATGWVQPTRNSPARRSLATGWVQPMHTLLTKKGPLTARSLGTKVNQNVFQPTKNFLTQSAPTTTRSLGTKVNQNVFQPTKNFLTQSAPATTRSLGTKVNQNVFQPTKNFLSRKGPSAAPSVGQRSAPHGSDILLRTADLPPAVRAAVVKKYGNLPVIPSSIQDIREALDGIQRAENKRKIPAGTTRELRKILKDKYNVTL